MGLSLTHVGFSILAFLDMEPTGYLYLRQLEYSGILSKSRLHVFGAGELDSSSRGDDHVGKALGVQGVQGDRPLDNHRPEATPMAGSLGQPLGVYS